MPEARVKCPTCGRLIEWSEASPYRPFCSERCKLIDFGAWLTEQRGIPGDTAPPQSGEEPAPPPEHPEPGKR